MINYNIFKFSTLFFMKIYITRYTAAVAYLGFFHGGGYKDFNRHIQYTQDILILLYTCCNAYKIRSRGGGDDLSPPPPSSSRYAISSIFCRYPYDNAFCSHALLWVENDKCCSFYIIKESQSMYKYMLCIYLEYFKFNNNKCLNWVTTEYWTWLFFTFPCR